VASGIQVADRENQNSCKEGFKMAEKCKSEDIFEALDETSWYSTVCFVLFWRIQRNNEKKNWMMGS